MITKHTIQLPDPNGQNKDRLAFVLDNVFTKAECMDFITVANKVGFEPALVNVGDGTHVLDTLTRKHGRCIIDSAELSGLIWDRIKEHIPISFDSKELVGINHRLRILKYTEGEYFRPHYDGSFEAGKGVCSLITVQLYLSGNCVGGSTRFLIDHLEPIGCDYKEHDLVVDIEPVPGRILIFEHDIYHEGSILESGEKYAVRTDVLYK
jgi:hypothetical protein